MVYVYCPEREEEDREGELVINFVVVKAKKQSDHRSIGEVIYNRAGYDPAPKYDEVPASLERVNSDWLKITFRSPLPPGEYVVTGIPKKNTSYPDDAYDFAVDN